MSGFEKVLNKKEICVVLSVSPRWIDNHMKKGLPFFRVGGLIRFRLSDIEKYLKERRVTA